MKDKNILGKKLEFLDDGFIEIQNIKFYNKEYDISYLYDPYILVDEEE